MSFFIKPPVAMSLDFIAFSGRNGRFSTSFIDIVYKLLTIIPSVCKHHAPFQRHMFQYQNGKIYIIPLSFTNHEIYRITISIYYSMDFCTDTTTTMPYFVWSPPFFSLRHYIDVPEQQRHLKKVLPVLLLGLVCGRYYRECIINPFSKTALNAFPWSVTFR